jgi:hypothetical protein
MVLATAAEVAAQTAAHQQPLRRCDNGVVSERVQHQLGAHVGVCPQSAMERAGRSTTRVRYTTPEHVLNTWNRWPKSDLVLSP